MAKRAAHTIVFLGGERTDRLDVGPGPQFEILSQNHLTAQREDDLAQRVETILISTSQIKVAKKVWVLCESANTQILDMPAGVVDGLDAEQLSVALSFETEPLTGVPAADSAITGIRLRGVEDGVPDFQRFWITQITASLRSSIEAAIVRSGSRLGGIVHPGGLQRGSWEITQEPRDWHRIEFWDQLVFNLLGRSDGSIQTRIIRSAEAESWISEVPSEGKVVWMAPRQISRAESSESGRAALWDLLAGSESPPDESKSFEATRLDFPAKAAPVEWLRAWVVQLSDGSNQIPVVEPLIRASIYKIHYIAGSIAASVVLAGCLAHAWWLTSQTARLKARADQADVMRSVKPQPTAEEVDLVAKNEKLNAKLAELNTTELAVKTEADTAAKKAEKIVTQQEFLDRLQSLHRSAVGSVLAALADFERKESPSDIIVKEVRTESRGELRLNGLCRSTSFSDVFASKLEARLKPEWKVGAAQKMLRDDRSAYDFTLVLTPVVLTDFSDRTALPSPSTQPRQTVQSGPLTDRSRQ